MVRLFAAAAVITMVAACAMPARADTPNPVASGDKPYWMHSANNTHYDGYCNAEQRDLVLKARAQFRKTLEKEVHDDEEAIRLKKVWIENWMLLRARERVAEFDKETAKEANKPIVDCTKPDGGHYPPIWAGAAVPDEFDPIPYRPKLIPLVPPPIHYKRFCSNEDADKFDEARRRTSRSLDINIALLGNYIYGLESLRDAYRETYRMIRRGVYLDKAAAIQKEIDRNYPELNKLFAMSHDLMKLYVSPPPDAPEPNCSSDHPSMTLGPAHPAKPTPPAGAKPGQTAGSKPMSAPDKKCTRDEGILGGINEVDCEIKKTH